KTRPRRDRRGGGQPSAVGRGCVNPVRQKQKKRRRGWSARANAVGGERARNNLGSQPEHLIGVEPGRIYRNGIGGCREGSDPTPAVARVAFLHVLQDIAVYNRRPALPQLPEAPLGPRLGARRDKKLDRRVGADGGADIAAVENRAAKRSRRMGRKVPLAV